MTLWVNWQATLWVGQTIWVQTVAGVTGIAAWGATAAATPPQHWVCTPLHGGALMAQHCVWTPLHGGADTTAWWATGQQ
jgi:hypothetical protein